MLDEYKIGALSELFGEKSANASGKDLSKIFKRQNKLVEQAFIVHTGKEELKQQAKTSQKNKVNKKVAQRFKTNSDPREEIVTISGLPVSLEGPSKKQKVDKYNDQNSFVERVDSAIPQVQSILSPPKIHVQDETEKTARTLFLGNLPHTCSKKKIKKMFKPFGIVESVRLRSAVPETPHIPKKSAIIEKKFHPQSDRINAYVVMTTKDSAIAALELNGTDVVSHRVRVDLAGNNIHDHKRSVFIGNMTYDIHEDQIWEFFQDCGEIANIRIIRDKILGIGKGFGYVLFSSVDSVMLALQKNGQELCGRNLRVFPAKNESKLKKKVYSGFKERSGFQGDRHKNLGNFKRSFEGERSKQDRRTKKDIMKKIRHPRQKHNKQENNIDSFVKSNLKQKNTEKRW